MKLPSRQHLSLDKCVPNIQAKYQTDIAPNPNIYSRMPQPSHTAGLGPILVRRTLGGCHQHLPPVHIQSQNKRIDLVRSAIDATMAPDNATILHVSVHTRPSPILRSAMASEYIVGLAVDHTPLLLLSRPTNTYSKTVPSGEKRHRRCHHRSIR